MPDVTQTQSSTIDKLEQLLRESQSGRAAVEVEKTQISTVDILENLLQKPTAPTPIPVASPPTEPAAPPEAAVPETPVSTPVPSPVTGDPLDSPPAPLAGPPVPPPDTIDEPNEGSTRERINNMASELDLAQKMLSDDLFVMAPTNVARLRRANQILESMGRPRINSLPDQLESPGYLTNLRRDWPKTVDWFANTPFAQSVAAGLEGTSVSMAQAIVQNRTPMQAPEGIGWQAMSMMIGLMADPLTLVGGGLASVVGKKFASKATLETIKAGQKLGRAAQAGQAAIKTGGTLSVLEGGRDPLRQKIETGEIDLVQTATTALKAGATGLVGGGVGGIFLGRAASAAGEIGAFTVAGSYIEHGVWPSLDDLIMSTIVVGGLKAVGSVGKKGGDVAAERLGKALFKRIRGEKLTPEENQLLGQYPEKALANIAADAQVRTLKESSTPITRKTLLTTDGALELARRHGDIARELINANGSSQSNFRALNSLLGTKDRLSAPERAQLKSRLEKIWNNRFEISNDALPKPLAPGEEAPLPFTVLATGRPGTTDIELPTRPGSDFVTQLRLALAADPLTKPAVPLFETEAGGKARRRTRNAMLDRITYDSKTGILTIPEEIGPFTFMDAMDRVHKSAPTRSLQGRPAPKSDAEVMHPAVRKPNLMVDGLSKLLGFKVEPGKDKQGKDTYLKPNGDPVSVKAVRKIEPGVDKRIAEEAVDFSQGVQDLSAQSGGVKPEPNLSHDPNARRPAAAQSTAKPPAKQPAAEPTAKPPAALIDPVAREHVNEPSFPKSGEPLNKVQENVAEQSDKAGKEYPENTADIPMNDVISTPSAKGKLRKLFDYLYRGGKEQSQIDAELVQEQYASSILRQMEFAIEDYNRGAKKAYGRFGKIPEAELKKLNDFLKHKLPAEQLPESMRAPMMKFRADIDALSAELINRGLVEGELAGVITDNMGIYVNRSFKIFDIPINKFDKYLKDIPLKLRRQGQALFRQELRESLGKEPTEQQLNGALDTWLRKTNEKGSPEGGLIGDRPGVRGAGIFKQRLDLPKVIRELFGEVTDPRAQYLNTVRKASSVLATTRMLKEVRAAGLGGKQPWLFEQPLGDFTKRIGDPAVDPLRAAQLMPLTEGKPLYTDTQNMKALEGMLNPSIPPWYMRWYYKVNGTMKIMKTAGSVQGIMRNFASNPVTSIQNGHVNPWHLLKAANVTGQDVLPGIWNFLKLSSPDLKAEVLELTELGVIRASGGSGEIRAMVKDASKYSSEDAYMERQASKLLAPSLLKAPHSKVFHEMGEAFRAGDDMWHAHAYYSELAAYRKIYPEKPLSEIKQMAADIVKKTTYTYSHTPFAVQQARRMPGAPNFVQFTAEVIRANFINMPRQTAKELADPRTRARGLQRLAGGLAVGYGVTEIPTFARMAAGVSLKQENAMREIMPTWMENSTLFHFGRTGEDGDVDRGLKWEVVDLSYSIPQAMITSAYTAMQRGDDPTESIIMGMKEFLGPFFDEPILEGITRDIFANRKISKGSVGQVYREEDPAWKQSLDISQYLVDGLEPGTTRSLNRVWKGYFGKPLANGTIPDFKTELLAMTTGQRIWTVDVPRDFGFNISALERRRYEANKIFFGAAFDRGEWSPGQVFGALERSKSALRDIFATSQKKIHAAKTLGMTDHEIISQMTGNMVRVSKRRAAEMLSGSYNEDALIQNFIYKLGDKEFDPKMPRVLDALGIGVNEALRHLAIEMQARGQTSPTKAAKARMMLMVSRLIDNDPIQLKDAG